MRLGLIAVLFAGVMLAQDTCLECHSALEDQLGAPAQAFANDIHTERGFGCVDCHGGDASEMDPELSMSPARGFRGKIARTAVPRLCGGCHSDANLIHQFNPIPGRLERLQERHRVVVRGSHGDTVARQRAHTVE